METKSPKAPSRAKAVRVRPNQSKKFGKSTVTNKTATSIEVEVGDDGALCVVGCCLEEQGE